MSGEHKFQINKIEQNTIEQTAADIASKKVRDFLNDPRLKFHFSFYRDIQSVLKYGILSPKFAEKAKIDISSNLGIRNPRAVSIVDREKNTPESGDWWLKHFTTGNYVGYLLPNDLKISEATPHPNESEVAFRIRPQKIEGLIVIDRPKLYERIINKKGLPSYSSLPILYLEDFFEITEKELESNNEELQSLSAAHKGLLEKLGNKIFDSPEVHNLLERKTKILESLAIEIIERKLDKKIEEVTELDFYIYFAKQKNLPLYSLTENLKSAKVLWPQPAK